MTRSKGKPLHERPGYRRDKEHPLITEVRSLARRHGLCAGVLIAFDGTYVKAVSYGASDKIDREMEALGRCILTDIDDGRLDPINLVDPAGSA